MECRRNSQSDIRCCREGRRACKDGIPVALWNNFGAEKRTKGWLFYPFSGKRIHDEKAWWSHCQSSKNLETFIMRKNNNLLDRDGRSNSNNMGINCIHSQLVLILDFILQHGRKKRVMNFVYWFSSWTNGSASHIKRELKGSFPSMLFPKGSGKELLWIIRPSFLWGWNHFLGALSLEKKALHRKET